MTTQAALVASAVLQTPPSSTWCTFCDGRSYTSVAVFPAGNTRAEKDADRTAAAHGDGAHVHYAARGDKFVVVTNSAEGV
jgi:hypothetical protein